LTCFKQQGEPVQDEHRAGEGRAATIQSGAHAPTVRQAQEYGDECPYGEVAEDRTKS
jgi:hypothetical protein